MLIGLVRRTTGHTPRRNVLVWLAFLLAAAIGLEPGDNSADDPTKVWINTETEPWPEAARATPITAHRPSRRYSQSLSRLVARSAAG